MRKLAFAATLGLCLLLAGCGGTKRVYLQGSYKPKQVVLGAGMPIKDVRWLSYGGDVAKANGMFVVNEC